MIDTRGWEAFEKGHLDGALFAPLGNAFHTVVGSYVEPSDAIVIVADAEHVDAIVRELVIIGLDRIAGFVTPATLTESRVATASASDVEVTTAIELVNKGAAVMLDVRRRAELATGSILDDARQIAHTRLPRHLDDIPKDRPLLVHCATGNRSRFAVAYLRRQGFDALNVAGGFAAFASAKTELAGQPR